MAIIEVIIRDYLKNIFDCPVYADVPQDPGERYITIERTGGGQVDYIRDATIAVQCTAKTRLETIKLHETVIQAMLEITTLDAIGGIDLSGESDYTDLSIKEYRYQSVYDIRYYQ